MLDFLRTLTLGGPVMIPLAVCSLFSIAVIIERALYYRRISTDSNRLMQQVRAAIEGADFAYASALCEGAPGPVAGVMAAGLRAAWRGRDTARAMEEQAMAELPAVSRRLVVLDTVVTLAPLLGLLGTVTGMIRSFHVVSRVGMSHPTGITAGIAEALIATATGLVIAIYSLIAYNYFLDRVKHVVSDMETRATQLETILRERPTMLGDAQSEGAASFAAAIAR